MFSYSYFLEHRYRITKEILERDGLKLELVNNQTPELCLIAIRQNPEAFRFVNRECQTEKVCRAAVKRDGMNLKYVKKTHITLELCFIAVKQNGLALKYVFNKTPEICLEAVRQNPLAIFLILDREIFNDVALLSI